jgi:predicted ATP-dependent serine protease
MIKKWSWNWLKFYREVCRGQCYSCNVWNSTLQEERSEQLKLEIGEEAHTKAKRARKPKKFTIEELEQIKQESISIVEKQLEKAENYI